MKTELVHKELSEAIIGSAMTVLNTLRPGLDENRQLRSDRDSVGGFNHG